MGLLAGELVFEVVRFLIMIVLLVAGVFIGGKLRAMSDAKKARKAAADGSDKKAITD